MQIVATIQESQLLDLHIIEGKASCRVKVLKIQPLQGISLEGHCCCINYALTRELKKLQSSYD